MLSQQTMGQEKEEGKKAAAPAVELSFSLETNCFATVFLREVMKQ
jgi:tRNA(Glu) U13 pseudouridine synthase TruD